MKKIQLILVMLLVSCLTAAAQSLTATGKVTYADDGSPVIGATIKVKGINTAVLTDVNGAYKITIPANAEKVLEVSFMGLQTKTIIVSQSGNYDVTMQPDATAIEEVVVTGYGNYTKKSYTGAATTVSTSRTKDVPSVSVQSRMAGAIPGLQITSSSGQPGSVESVRVRGMGSINAGNEPLYVVDGVPMTVSDAGTFGTYTSTGNSVLSTINPNDIENLTVIKDAAAASLYGSRAANGVIVITTKKGIAGKTKFNVKASLGFSDMAMNWRPVLDGDATVNLWTHALQNYGVYKEGMNEADASQFAKDNIGDFYTKPWSGWTNWRDHLLKVGTAQTYEFSAQGGNEKTRFFTSLAYTDMEGITLSSDYKRITGRANVTHKSGIFTLEASAMYSNIEQDVNSEGTSYAAPMMNIAIGLSPGDYPYNEDGSINIENGFPFAGRPIANPLQSSKYNYNKSAINRVQTSVSGKLDIYDGLAVKEILSYDFMNSNNRVWWDPRTGDGVAANGVYQRHMLNNSTLTSQTQLTYDKIFNEKHGLNLLAAFESESLTEDFVSASGQDYPNTTLPEIDNAGTQSGGSSKDRNTLLSFVAKGDYNYDGRYYIGGSYRRDGSSRLAKDTRWGNFWSVSGSWRMSQEKFWKDGGINNVLTESKLRASYGVNGTQPSSWYGYMGVFGYGYNYNGTPGSTETRIPNPNLRWEKNNALNIGLDLTFINRISLSVDYYNRDTKDLILAQPISSTTGFQSTLTNIGSMRNRGVEIDIRAVAIQTEDVSWTLGLNMAHNRNTLTGLADGQTEIQNGRWVHRIGNPYYSFNLFEYAGVDPATGKEQYYTNAPIYATPGDPKSEVTGYTRDITTDASKVNKAIVGSWEPKLQGGITSNFNWKFIDFNFTFTYSLGGQCVDNMAVNYTNGSGWAQDGIAIPAFNDIDKMWKKPGDIAELPMYIYGGGNDYTSNRFVASTDHLRLKNVTLGFTAPKKWLAKIGVERLRIYASANNLFTIKDKNLYVDPETPVGGSVGFETPQLRTISFGLEIGF